MKAGKHRGGVRGFALKLLALLLESSFLNGAELCGGKQKAKTKSTYI